MNKGLTHARGRRHAEIIFVDGPTYSAALGPADREIFLYRAGVRAGAGAHDGGVLPTVITLSDGTTVQFAGVN